MVDVGVGKDDFLHHAAHFLNCLEDEVYFPAGIDNGCFTGLRALDDRAILLVRRDRHDGTLKRVFS